MQFYDPNKLITDVEELLRNRGLNPQPGDSSLTLTGACTLLRGLGIMPAINAVDAYKHTLENEPWPDADDRRATRQP